MTPTKSIRPVSTHDLLPSEQRFVAALHQLGFGRLERVRIQGGELVLDPWPTFVSSVKFGTATSNQPQSGSEEYELKHQVAELFAHVRSMDSGIIQVLEVRGGLPFSMEIACDSNSIHNDNGSEV